ncbi:MAG: hypothetical protein QXS54_12975, partial [Candidatus Methanomethylicaceae archaeon]
MQRDFSQEETLNRETIKAKLINLFESLNDKVAIDIMKKNRVSQTAEILSAVPWDEHPPLERHILDALEQMRSQILEKFPNFSEIYDYIQVQVYEHLRHARAYEVNGLFVNQYEQGEVRKIRVTILEPTSVKEDKVIYGFKIAEGKRGDMLRQTVEMARTSAIRMLREFIRDA